ncbi:aminomethyltransferase beta-barrel domain-containing protein [Candidatus Thiosymbion oneisti]|uniref:aminomethyltransferase beta-barrel domain-containing protein n=1 Tax=Candidatus Thiosymbion oneisti TaxID=589554 RepID=UPI003C7BBC53
MSTRSFHNHRPAPGTGYRRPGGPGRGALVRGPRLRPILVQGHTTAAFREQGYLMAALIVAEPVLPFRLVVGYVATVPDCTLIELGDDRCRVRFARPQRAVTPGQAAVFYQRVPRLSSRAGRAKV